MAEIAGVEVQELRPEVRAALEFSNVDNKPTGMQFGVRQVVAALGLEGRAVNRVIIDVEHGSFAKVYIFHHVRTDHMDPLLALLQGLPVEAIVSDGGE